MDFSRESGADHRGDRAREVQPLADQIGRRHSQDRGKYSPVHIVRVQNDAERHPARHYSHHKRSEDLAQHDRKEARTAAGCHHAGKTDEERNADTVIKERLGFYQEVYLLRQTEFLQNAGGRDRICRCNDTARHHAHRKRE